jgi:hypothetical protein
MRYNNGFHSGMGAGASRCDGTKDDNSRHHSGVYDALFKNTTGSQVFYDALAENARNDEAKRDRVNMTMVD